MFFGTLAFLTVGCGGEGAPGPAVDAPPDMNAPPDMSKMPGYDPAKGGMAPPTPAPPQ